MRRLSLTLSLIAVLALVSGGLTPAEARHDWIGAAAFEVGGLSFSFGYNQPYGYVGHYTPLYYYRVSAPFQAHGYSCDTGCYRDSGHYYHTAYCPVVRYYFSSYGYTPYGYSPHGYHGPSVRYYSGYYGYDSHHGRPGVYGHYDHGRPGIYRHWKGHQSNGRPDARRPPGRVDRDDHDDHRAPRGRADSGRHARPRQRGD